MKTLYSREYYKNNAESISKQRGVIDFEKELNVFLGRIEKELFSKEEYEKIEKGLAAHVVEFFKKELLEEKELYLKVKEDSNCLGYTSKFQEIKEANRIITVFEFNCYRLSKFKEKYGL